MKKTKDWGKFLTSLYGVYETPDEIDFEALPSKFVKKTTSGSGDQNVIIVKDKTSIDIKELRRKLRVWNGANNLGTLSCREWAYYTCKPRIIVERILEVSSERDVSLTDYKFFCFEGLPEYVQIDTGRFGEHRHNCYDLQWLSLGVHCTYPEGDHLFMMSCQIDNWLWITKR